MNSELTREWRKWHNIIVYETGRPPGTSSRTGWASPAPAGLGAQSILWLRAIAASGDHDAYWDWHITQEHHRNHRSRYQDPASLELAA